MSERPDGERILLDLRPSPWFVVLRAAPWLLLALAASLAGWPEVVDRGGAWFGWSERRRALTVLLRAGPWLVAAGTTAWVALDWATRRYTLTDRRVLRAVGVLRRTLHDAPVSSVQHTVVDRSALQRVLGIGSIGFATAGSVSVEFTWYLVAHPLDVLERVRERWPGPPRASFGPDVG